MITKEDVRKIAKLAKMGISKEEEEKFAKELSSILDYIKKLEEVNVSSIDPASHSIKVENIMRKDKAEPRGKDGGAKKLLDLAPETKEGYLKTKSVF